MKFKLPKSFLGWSNLKWLAKELINVYSSGKSFFSKKRLESGMAFLIGQFGMVYFLLQKIGTMSGSDLAIWAGIEFAIAGYMISQIEKGKKKGTDSTEEVE